MSDEGKRRESLRVTLIERLSLDELREASFDLAFNDCEGLTKRELAIDLAEPATLPGQHRGARSWLAILLGLMTFLTLVIALLTERLTPGTRDPAGAARVTATRTLPLTRATPIGGDVLSGLSATPAIQASESLIPGSKSLPAGIYRLELALQGSPIPLLVGRFTVQ